MLVGVKWGDLSEETKLDLLEKSNCVNAFSGDFVNEGECIVDLTETLSVIGKVVDNGEERVIEVDDNEIIYNPCKGIELSVKEDVIFEINNIFTANEASKIWGISEGAIRKAIASKKLIFGVDYRKAGRITLITKEAMERLYGKLEELND